MPGFLAAHGSAPRFRRGAGTVAFVAGVALGLTSCGSSGNTSTAAVRISPSDAHASPSSAPVPKGAPQAIPDLGLTQGMVLPLEAYMETYPEQAAIMRAQVSLVSSCMAKFNFQYDPPVADAPLSNDDANMNRRYGISDPSEAAQYGYHLPNYTASQPQYQVSATEQEILVGHLGTDFRPTPGPTTYNGVPIPHNGCIGSSTAKLGATLNTQLPDQLDSESLSISQSKPAVQTALHAWSACMKSKGYRVDTPFNAAALAPSSDGPSPTSQEIQVAMADVGCKQQTGLIKIWFTAETAVQDQQIDQNQLALTQLRRQIDAAVKASAAVTG